MKRLKKVFILIIILFTSSNITNASILCQVLSVAGGSVPLRVASIIISEAGRHLGGQLIGAGGKIVKVNRTSKKGVIGDFSFSFNSKVYNWK